MQRGKPTKVFLRPFIATNWENAVQCVDRETRWWSKENRRRQEFVCVLGIDGFDNQVAEQPVTKRDTLSSQHQLAMLVLRAPPASSDRTNESSILLALI